jgi:hypothetical protein
LIKRQLSSTGVAGRHHRRRRTRCLADGHCQRHDADRAVHLMDRRQSGRGDFLDLNIGIKAAKPLPAGLFSLAVFDLLADAGRRPPDCRVRPFNRGLLRGSIRLVLPLFGHC